MASIKLPVSPLQQSFRSKSLLFMGRAKMAVLGCILAIAAISPSLVNLNRGLASIEPAIQLVQNQNAAQLHDVIAQATNTPATATPSNTPEPTPNPTAEPTATPTTNSTYAYNANSNCTISQKNNKLNKQAQSWVNGLQSNFAMTDAQIEKWLNDQGLKGKARAQAKAAAKSWRQNGQTWVNQNCNELNKQLSDN